MSCISAAPAMCGIHKKEEKEEVKYAGDKHVTDWQGGTRPGMYLLRQDRTEKGVLDCTRAKRADGSRYEKISGNRFDINDGGRVLWRLRRKGES